MISSAPNAEASPRNQIKGQEHRTLVDGEWCSYPVFAGSLAEALSADAIAAYNKKSTGEKYLIDPNKDV